VYLFNVTEIGYLLCQCKEDDTPSEKRAYHGHDESMILIKKSE